MTTARPGGWGVLLLCAVAAFSGCEATPRAKRVDPIVRDVPEVLRGTIGAEATFRGVEPVLVSGLGVVVGLSGTGGKPLPDRVAATMEREMGLKGIGKALTAGSAIDGMTPRQLLRDQSVAVVEVVAAVPSGAPAGHEFDVLVRALNADSLEGGQLWSTELRLGEASVFGAQQARTMATASGAIFVNPFADPGLEGQGVTQTRGRVLAGGRVTNPMKLEIVLDNPSHQRATAVVSAINSRFPLGAGDPGATAMGRMGGSESGPTIALRVPNRWSRKPEEFLEIVKHLSIDEDAGEARARRFVEAAKSEPSLSGHLAWCLEAIGDKAVPFCRELYEHAEPGPRAAGLRAGARLGDNRATPILKEMAEKSRGAERLEAIGLLSKIEGGPTVDVTLRKLLAERDLTVRVAAYEALAARAERGQRTAYDLYRRQNPYSKLAHVSPQHMEALAESVLPPGTIQGVERELVADRFFLDQVRVGEPLVYVTQQGRPRIVLFGEKPSLDGPVLVSAWSDRLMVTGDKPGGTLRVYYRDGRGSEAVTTSVPGDVAELIRFMARVSTPEDPRPGLGLSYSEVVGALCAVQEQTQSTAFAFATEQDRLRGLLADATQSLETRDRPETRGEAEEIVRTRAELVDKPLEVERGPRIVPIGGKGKK